jgi:vacuole morphology and inheritance protein 14
VKPFVIIQLKKNFISQNSDQFINDLVVPILNCLLDSDTRVRYFASESLYNIVKVARGSVLPLFPDLFQALSRLCTDPDTQVKNGSELLDRILKDIVTENNSNFSLEAFMPLLRDGVYTKNSFVRQFIISWISVRLHLI